MSIRPSENPVSPVYTRNTCLRQCGMHCTQPYGIILHVHQAYSMGRRSHSTPCAGIAMHVWCMPSHLTLLTNSPRAPNTRAPSLIVQNSGEFDTHNTRMPLLFFFLLDASVQRWHFGLEPSISFQMCASVFRSKCSFINEWGVRRRWYGSRYRWTLLLLLLLWL